MKQTKQEAKLIQISDDFTKETGIVMENQAYGVISSREKAFICMLRGLLIFLILFGITGLLITSFELPCNAAIIYVSEFIFSVLISFLYYNKWLFNFGYVLVLILFIVFAIVFREIANSGFNAILNIILNIIDDRMNLDGVRQYTEQIANRELTVTVCLLMVSFFGVCYFNSTISGYMSPFWVFVQTYPLLQICIYLDDEINYFFAGCIVASWLGICLIRRSGRFRVNLKPQILFFSYKKKHFRYEERSFHHSVHGLFATGVCFGCLLMVLTLGIAKLAPMKYRDNQSSLESGIDAWVENFALNGIFGFFNSYQATGGISGGQLGGVRSVSMDFQTDLEVTYVPYSTDTLYLKGYVGEYYTSHAWIQLSNYEDLKGAPYYFSYSDLVNKESSILSVEHNLSQSPKAVMEIKNVGASTDYYYMPYYTEVDSDTLIYGLGSEDVLRGDIVDSRSLIGESYRITYYPALQSSYNIDNTISELNREMEMATAYDSVSGAGGSGSALLEMSNKLYKISEILSLYQTYTDTCYLQVPKDIRNTLDTVISENGLDESLYGVESTDSLSYEELQNVVRDIQNYFIENFTYSLNPGKTPDNKDFAEYFLTKQKNGYCAHFATAGCLLLREMGIPARYVEGYAVDINAATDVNSQSDENAADWYEGYNSLGNDDELQVLTVSVTDASAHAWVEVYLDDFGWIPVEFTVAEEEETEVSDFWSQFRSFFTGDNSNTQSIVTNITGTVKQSGEYILLGVLCVFGLILIIWYLRRLIRMSKLYYKRSNSRLVCQYQALAKLFRKYGLAPAGNLYHEDMKTLLKKTFSMDEGVCDLYIDYVVKASFGKDKLPSEELEWSTEIFKSIIRNLRQKVSFKHKLVLLLKY